MRVIVFSDIHGNPYACKAVLQAIKKEGAVDAVVAAGDLCLGGSDPAACVDMLAGGGICGVFGNTEEYIYQPEEMPPDELHRGMWERIKPVAYWVRKTLSTNQMDWLQALPFEQRFSPTGTALDDMLVVHANPKNNELMIYPGPDGQRELWEEVRQPDEDPELGEVLNGVNCSKIAFGHFHYTHERRLKDLHLVDVAPCSMPSIDRDPRARYTIFTWGIDGWEVTRRWVEYDFFSELKALKTSDMPFREDFMRYFD